MWISWDGFSHAGIRRLACRGQGGRLCISRITRRLEHGGYVVSAAASALDWLAWSFLLVAAGYLRAQEAAEDAERAESPAVPAGNRATTFEELNQILDAGRHAAQPGPPSPQLDKYLTNLQAWVLHRRGEAYVKQAAEANAAGQADISRQLDGKAMEDFDAAIKLDPQRWKSYHHRGVCFALAGEFEKALSDFTKTIELRPEYESAWFNRGEIHYEMGQFAKAIADYDEAIRRASERCRVLHQPGPCVFSAAAIRQGLGRLPPRGGTRSAQSGTDHQSRRCLSAVSGNGNGRPMIFARRSTWTVASGGLFRVRPG